MEASKRAVKFDLTRDGLRTFFEGRYYPLLIALLVTVGSLTATEFFLNIIVIFLAVASLIVCDTVKPLLMPLITLVLQVSIPNAPGYPTHSDYYYTSWRLPVLIVLGLAVVFGFVFFIVRNGLYKKLSFKSTPLLLPLILLSGAFLLNGAFSESWRHGSLIYGAVNVFVYLFLFLFIFLGLREGGEELAGYFAYISMITAFIIAIELGALYIASDNVLVDGTINKEGIALGWGIWNLIGVSSAVLIPTCFLGMEKNRYPWLYFAAATLAYITAVLSMSRNALLFGSLIYAASAFVLCFIGKNRRPMRVISALGIAFVALMIVILWDKIMLLLKENIDINSSGDASNGRFALWGKAFDAFLASPVFGSGFYGLADVETAVFGFTPKMAHNTLFELLSATGIFGTGAYIYYRTMSVIPFVKRPSLTKTMLGLSVLTLLLESLLDNFVFNIYPMFYAVSALAIVFRLTGDAEDAASRDKKQ